MRKMFLFILLLVLLFSIDLVYSTHCSTYSGTTRATCESDGGTGYDCCIWNPDTSCVTNAFPINCPPHTTTTTTTTLPACSTITVRATCRTRADCCLDVPTDICNNVPPRTRNDFGECTTGTTTTTLPAGNIKSRIGTTGPCNCDFYSSGSVTFEPQGNSPPCVVETGYIGIPQTPQSGVLDQSCSCNVRKSLSCSPPNNDGNYYTYSTACSWSYTGLGFNAQGYAADCRSRDNNDKCWRNNGQDPLPTVPPSGTTNNLPCDPVLLSDGTTPTISGSTCNNYNSVVGSGFCRKSCSDNTQCPTNLRCNVNFCDSCTSSAQCDINEVCSAGRCVANNPPTVSLSPTSATITSGSSQLYSITKSDLNGDTVTVNCPITLAAGLSFVGTCSSGMTSFSVTSSTPGTYTNGITVNVNDGRGGTASGSASLTVNACGGVGQACCGSTCNAGNVCSAGTCVLCGADGQPACVTGCNAGNVNVGGTCFIDCTLQSASISGSSCGANGCQAGEGVSMSFTYTGACLYRNINNIQVDASTTGCNVQYDPALSNVDNQFNKNSLTGFQNLHLSDGSRTINTNSDPISSIDPICITKTVSATAAALRNGLPSAIPNFVAGSVAGSVKFGCTLNSQCTGGRTCDISTGNCNCPSGFTFNIQTQQCEPSFFVCYKETSPLDGTGIDTTQDCDYLWTNPANQLDGKYWQNALVSPKPNNKNCFQDVGTIVNKQACLYKLTELGSEWGEYFFIKVKDNNNNLVSGCTTSVDCASNTNDKVTCRSTDNICI